MNEPDEILIFDTGPLSHLAKQNWLGTLKAVVGDRRAIIPDFVERELIEGAIRDPQLRPVLDASWIERHPLASDDELAAFATFSSFLVEGTRNRGEAAVLALVSTIPGAIAVVDDGAARRVAELHGLPKRPTLALVCEAIRSGLLTVRLASALVDDLIASEYRLPFGPGGFAAWAEDHGQLGA